MTDTLLVSQRSTCLQEEIQFEMLLRLHKPPDMSQRALANELGVNLGIINFCVQALVKMAIKMRNFSKGAEKLRYVYFLTPTGLAEKSKLTSLF